MSLNSSALKKQIIHHDEKSPNRIFSDPYVYLEPILPKS